MRLAAIYNTWEGDEWLPLSINSINKHVDYVIVVYQNVSNYGEAYQPIIPSHLVDFAIHYSPDLRKSGTVNETNKRNIGLNRAKELGCTHFILMDNDELYEEKEFEYYKNLIEYNNCDASACRLYTYYKYPTIQLTPLEDYFVPFITKLYPHTKVGGYSYPVLCDPTRKSSTCSNFYTINMPLMHHYSWCRNDIGRKLRNSSARKAFSGQLENLIKKFNDFEKTGELAYYTNFSWIEIGRK